MRLSVASVLLASAIASAAASARGQAAANPIGTACMGSNGLPTLAAGSAPRLGMPMTLTLTNLPTAPGFVWWLWGTDTVSWGGMTLPVELGFIGAPGCMLYVSPEFVTIQDQPASTLSATFLVPVSFTPFVGCRVVTQVFVCDFGFNALGYTTTNALELILGV